MMGSLIHFGSTWGAYLDGSGLTGKVSRAIGHPEMRSQNEAGLIKLGGVGRLLILSTFGYQRHLKIASRGAVFS